MIAQRHLYRRAFIHGWTACGLTGVKPSDATLTMVLDRVFPTPPPPSKDETHE